MLIVILIAWPQLAWGHGVKLFATVEHQQVQGMAYFVGGSPAASCALRLLDAAGREFSQTTTDPQGKFTIMLPQELRGAFTLHLLAGSGHSATLDLNTIKSHDYLEKPIERQTSGSLADSLDISQSLLDRQLEQHLAPIRQQLLELRATSAALTIEKILAGLGYIAGIIGLLTYIHYRKRLKQLNEKKS